MILSLRGRIETRLFLIAAVGIPWAAFTTVLTAGGAEDLPRVLGVMVVMAVLGMFWEGLYHGLQQLRWDRDWPSSLALGALLLEIGPLWWSCAQVPGLIRPGPQQFILVTCTAWILMWGFVQGPLRVLFIRWRYNGGRISSLR